MNTRKRTRKFLSLLLTVSMLFGIMSAMPIISSAEDYELELVWQPNLVGAKNDTPTARNYVSDANGNRLGFLTSSSTSRAAISFLEDGTMRFENTHTSSGLRLNISVAGTGTGGSSAVGYGFEPREGGIYRIEVRARNADLDGPFNLQNFYDYAAPAGSKPATLKPGTTDVFYYDFVYKLSERTESSANDSGHGVMAVGIPSGSTGIVIHYSDIKIYELIYEDCEDCGEYPCVCVCEVCGQIGKENCLCCPDCNKYPCECPCEFCGQFPCVCEPPTVIAEWDFTAANYPDAVAPATNPQSPLPGVAWRGVKELPASGGPGAANATLIRNHDKQYPAVEIAPGPVERHCNLCTLEIPGPNEDGLVQIGNPNASGPYDNTNVVKHMNVVADGWIKTYGWSTSENYIYLKFNATDYDNLILKYNIRATSTSTPDGLALQYSFDGNNWNEIVGADVPTRPITTAIAREEHLPSAVYNQPEVWIRWFGSSSSTSGHIEFKDISLETNVKAKPMDGGEQETVFTHITIAPGKDPSELGFAWFTAKNDKSAAVIQYVEVPEDWNGTEMPAGATEVTGVNAAGSSLYDTNKVTVTGLKPSTKYAYRVGDGTNWTKKVYTFKTQNPDSYTVMVVADPQVTSRGAGLWGGSLKRAVAREPDFAFILSAGDHTGDANDINQVNGFLAPPELRNYPFAATYGNHDHQMPETYEQIRYLPLIYQWPNAMPVSEGNLFVGHDWYFSYGDVLYLNIDSNIKNTDLHEPFMQAAKASHPDAAWIVANFHHDIYGGSRHAGSYYADSAAMQKTWSPFLDKHGVDVAFNGHDHLYTRSKVIKNDEIQRFQMFNNFGSSVTTLIKGKMTHSPGRMISPNGIQYMALATPGDKFYELEDQNWIDYADGMTSQPEYTLMKVDNNNLVIDTYRRVTDDTDRLVDSITLRKRALREDLEEMLPGAKEVAKGSIKDPGWTAFQSAITAADGVLGNAAATDEQIHNAFTAVYDAYFKLEVTSNKAKLAELVDEVTEALATSAVGKWLNQYSEPAKKALQDSLKPAVEVNDQFLPVEAELNAVYDDLNAKYTAFKNSAGTVPFPWTTLHQIKSTGKTMVELIGWMDEDPSKTFSVSDGAQTVERYDTSLTKGTYAKDGKERTTPLFGPDNDSGGRSDDANLPANYEGAHIRNANIGEWVRYELDVEQAGSYSVKLGVKNTGAAQTVLLRDTAQNVLAEFNVNANHAASSTWNNAPLVNASTEVYLTKGRNIIELYFEANKANPSSATSYASLESLSVDILEFERTGNGTPFAPPSEPNKYYLPDPGFPGLAAGAQHTQRGWGLKGYVDEHGTPGTIPKDIFKAATHLVLELAGGSNPSGNLQFVAMSDSTNWEGTDNSNRALYWNSQTRTLTIPFDQFPEQQKHLQNSESKGALILAYYASGYNELNVKRAYLLIDGDDNPCKSGHTPKTDNCGLCADCGMVLQKTCSETPCISHNPEHDCYKGHSPKAANCLECSKCDTVLERSCTPANPCTEHAKGDDPWDSGIRNVTIKYNPDATEQWAIWGEGNEFLFSYPARQENATYRLEFDITNINSLNVRETITVDDIGVWMFALGNESTNYAWKALTDMNYVVTQTGNVLVSVGPLNEETLGFPYSSIQNFGVQIAILDAAQSKFDPQDSVVVTVDFKLYGNSGNVNCDCDEASCDICSENGKWRALGDVDGDENGVVSIFDALEVLKCLVNMQGAIIKSDNTFDEVALKAALISENSFATDPPRPTIFCALEILKKLVNMDSIVDGVRINGTRGKTPA